jgi:hypothetical protein
LNTCRVAFAVFSMMVLRVASEDFERPPPLQLSMSPTRAVDW